ncbi:thioredoxin family protein [Cryobacterium sp. SO1]|uniref:TlpA family protein disulfide reductase n=1 Tax=Cryobacterium sp. SO1 TaxID=1897061 RepID=UPI001022A1E3|nr:thioredoxin family protein [Cryobacterium sp. SO1]RZI37491.1 hypothetical protein BJQ95_00042 [Cryobacterium sp. SO1]
MNPAAALLVLVLLVALTCALGFLWRRRQGRVSSASADLVTAAELGLPSSDSAPVFGAEATLLQFSTEFCSRCPGTSTLLRQVADGRSGVRHVDVDITCRADLARRFNVLQTPTTLVLDGAGQVRARVGGVPNRAALHAHLDDLARDVQEFR